MLFSRIFEGCWLATFANSLWHDCDYLSVISKCYDNSGQQTESLLSVD